VGTTSQPLGFPAPLARHSRRANGTGRAHRLSVRSTPEIHYGSNGFRTLTCFEEPLHLNCILSAPLPPNRPEQNFSQLLALPFIAPILRAATIREGTPLAVPQGSSAKGL